MITVSFNQVDEFVKELKQSNEFEILKHTVRLTRLYRRDGTLPIQRVSIVATFVTSSWLVRLDQHIGQVWGNKSQEDAAVEMLCQKAVAEIEKQCAEQNLIVTAGVFTND